MPRVKYTEYEDNFLRENHNRLSVKHIAHLLNRSIHSIYRHRKLLNLHAAEPCRYYTDEEISFIKNHYHKLGNIEIGKILGRGRDSVRGIMKKNGWKRTNEEINIIINRSDIIKTRFKKEEDPLNKKQVGYISTRWINPLKLAYKYIKIAEPNVWEPYHRHLFKQWYPDLDISNKPVIFKDGNTLNCDKDNLIIVDRAWLAHNNHPFHKNKYERVMRRFTKSKKARNAEIKRLLSQNRKINNKKVVKQIISPDISKMQKVIIRSGLVIYTSLDNDPQKIKSKYLEHDKVI